MQQAAVLQNNGQYIGVAQDEVFLAIEFEFGTSLFVKKKKKKKKQAIIH